MENFEENYGFLLFQLIYIIGSSIGLGCSITCLYFTIFEKEVINPFFIIICIMGFMGALLTSIISIKEWRKWRKQNKEIIDNKEGK